MKQYRLLKDAPTVKAGTISCIADNNIDYIFSGVDGCFLISESEILKRPDWFEEVKPFEWTDELVIEFLTSSEFAIPESQRYSFFKNYILTIIEKFKQQKAQ